MKHIICILVSCLMVSPTFTQQKNVELTHYLFPEFTDGIILMNSGMQQNALLNYNSLTEELIFGNNGRKLAIAKKEVDLIDTVFIKDRKFVVLNGGFVEYLYHSKPDLYIEHKCRVSQPGKPSGYGGTSKTTAIGTTSVLYSSGSVYELKLPDDYKIEPYKYYWLKRNTELIRFTSMRDLKKFYSEKEDQFKEFVKRYDVKYEDQEGIVQLIEYLESD